MARKTYACSSVFDKRLVQQTKRLRARWTLLQFSAWLGKTLSVPSERTVVVFPRKQTNRPGNIVNDVVDDDACAHCARRSWILHRHLSNRDPYSPWMQPGYVKQPGDILTRFFHFGHRFVPQADGSLGLPAWTITLYMYIAIESRMCIPRGSLLSNFCRDLINLTLPIKRSRIHYAEDH